MFLFAYIDEGERSVGTRRWDVDPWDAQGRESKRRNNDVVRYVVDAADDERCVK